MTDKPALRIWLDRKLSNTENGHFQLEGTYGSEAVVVVLDPTITAKLPESGKEEAILAMHREIEEAAMRRFSAHGASRVHKYHSSEFDYNLIALTDEDLALV